MCDQGVASDVLLDQEQMPLLLEERHGPRGQTVGCQPFQHRGLVAQHVAGVGAIEQRTDMRPRLLDHDLVAGGLIGGQVHPALVAVADGLADHEAAGEQDRPGRLRRLGNVGLQRAYGPTPAG